RSGCDGDHSSSQQSHPEDIQRLTAHVLLTHVYDAFKAESGTYRGGRHAMLTRSGFSYDPPLAHPSRQQHLTHRVVDLVRAGVVEVLALQPDACTHVLGEARRGGHRSGTTHVRPE